MSTLNPEWNPTLKNLIKIIILSIIKFTFMLIIMLALLILFPIYWILVKFGMRDWLEIND